MWRSGCWHGSSGVFFYVPDTTGPLLPTTSVPTARVLTVHTADGLDLLAWLAPPADDARPVVLYLSWQWRQHRLPRGTVGAAEPPRLGVLLLEYRGYGGNPGTPTEAGLNADAPAGYAALIASGVAPRRVILWGKSLGSGIAVHLATEVAVGAVVLESPYTSILAIAQRRFPVVPVAWLLQDRFDLIGRIAAVHAPVLVMTGERDVIVPPAMGRAVFGAANRPKVLWLAPNAGHNNLTEAGAFEVVQTFVRQHWKARRNPVNDATQRAMLQPDGHGGTATLASLIARTGAAAGPNAERRVMRNAPAQRATDMTDTFDHATFATLRDTDEVAIHTSANPERGVIIWIVTVGDRVFARSFRGPGAKWYTAAIADRQATLALHDRRWPVGVAPVADPAVMDAVSAAYPGNMPALLTPRRWCAPEILATTLRLDPT